MMDVNRALQLFKNKNVEKKKRDSLFVPIYFICNLKVMTYKYSTDKDKDKDNLF